MLRVSDQRRPRTTAAHERARRRVRRAVRRRDRRDRLRWPAATARSARRSPRRAGCPRCPRPSGNGCSSTARAALGGGQRGDVRSRSAWRRRRRPRARPLARPRGGEERHRVLVAVCRMPRSHTPPTQAAGCSRKWSRSLGALAPHWLAVAVGPDRRRRSWTHGRRGRDRRLGRRRPVRRGTVAGAERRVPARPRGHRARSSAAASSPTGGRRPRRRRRRRSSGSAHVGQAAVMSSGSRPGRCWRG